MKRLPVLEALVVLQNHRYPGPLSALTEGPILCPSLKTIAFVDCMVTPDLFKQLEEVVVKRRHSTAASLHRVVIVNGTWSLPDVVAAICEFRMSIPCVDTVAGGELPDLL